jgi:hypothetical protein
VWYTLKLWKYTKIWFLLSFFYLETREYYFNHKRNFTEKLMDKEGYNRVLKIREIVKRKVYLNLLVV